MSSIKDKDINAIHEICHFSVPVYKNNQIFRGLGAIFLSTPFQLKKLIEPKMVDLELDPFFCILEITIGHVLMEEIIDMATNMLTIVGETYYSELNDISDAIYSEIVQYEIPQTVYEYPESNEHYAEHIYDESESYSVAMYTYEVDAKMESLYSTATFPASYDTVLQGITSPAKLVIYDLGKEYKKVVYDLGKSCTDVIYHPNNDNQTVTMYALVNTNDDTYDYIAADNSIYNVALPEILTKGCIILPASVTDVNISMASNNNCSIITSSSYAASPPDQESGVRAHATSSVEQLHATIQSLVPDTPCPVLILNQPAAESTNLSTPDEKRKAQFNFLPPPPDFLLFSPENACYSQEQC